MKYRTRQGDVLDAICHAYYGSKSYSVEAVYRANPGLAALGPVYAAGVIIELPDTALIRPETQSISLWD